MKNIGFAILLTCAAVPAMAGPRDDVMANLYRCSSIYDDKAWLACYHAAAQPMEAAQANGAPRAPGYAPAYSSVAPPVAGAPAAVAMAPAPKPSSSAWFGFSSIFGSKPAAQTPQQFGGENLAANQPVKAGGLDYISAHVARYSFSNQGYVTLVLDNGQTWRQLNGDSSVMTLALPPARYVATIKRGFMGSYNLTIKGVAGLYRVERIA